MMSKDEALRTLGLNQFSTNKEIQSQYYELAKEFHPDTNPLDSSKMVQLNEAYEILIPKTKVSDSNSSQKQNDAIVLGIQTARTDLLNNWNLWEAWRKKEKEKMNELQITSLLPCLDDRRKTACFKV